MQGRASLSGGRSCRALPSLPLVPPLISGHMLTLPGGALGGTNPINATGAQPINSISGERVGVPVLAAVERGEAGTFLSHTLAPVRPCSSGYPSVRSHKQISSLRGLGAKK